MPELDAFPQSHIITFKYYFGVIQFLEEDYAAVCTGIPTHLRCPEFRADILARQRKI